MTKGIPTEEEIIKKVINLKEFIRSLDLQMGIGGITEKIIINKLNKIIRMLKKPTRRINFKNYSTLK